MSAPKETRGSPLIGLRRVRGPLPRWSRQHAQEKGQILRVLHRQLGVGNAVGVLGDAESESRLCRQGQPDLGGHRVADELRHARHVGLPPKPANSAARQRLYLEVMEEVLSKVRKYVVDAESGERLNLRFLSQRD